MKRALFLTPLITFFFVALAGPLPQAETLALKLTRDFGYGGLNGHIQGKFSLRASGPENLTEVQFLIDGEVVFTDSQPPYRYQFETGEYVPGQHTMSAVGLLADGSEIYAPSYERTFITSEEAKQETKKIVIPILLVTGAITLLGITLPLVIGKKRKHQPGEYGLAGGAVCSRCKLPFARNFLSPNLIFGKLERCPHCGKWSITPRASAAALEEAEARLASQTSGPMQTAADDQEHLKKLIDDSRFFD